MSRYIGTAETAKLVRNALKRAFPGVKFSVRSHSYSMGSSIYVRWMDGPMRSAVESVVSVYQGGRFDGMIDLAYSVDSYLMADGSASLAQSSGTEASRGCDPAFKAFKPSPDAERVRFGVSSISCTREHSEGLIRRALERIQRKYGADWFDLAEVRIVQSVAGGFYVADAHAYQMGSFGDLQNVMHRELARRSCFVRKAA